MHYFKSLLLRGLLELKKHVDSILKLVEIMSYSSEINCFRDRQRISLIMSSLKERFLFNKNEVEILEIVDKWVLVSYDNWRTNYYDKFQLMTNGILP